MIVLSQLRFSVFISCTIGVLEMDFDAQTPLNILELSYIGHGKSEIEVSVPYVLLTQEI
jgi:hypothetical protein